MPRSLGQRYIDSLPLWRVRRLARRFLAETTNRVHKREKGVFGMEYKYRLYEFRWRGKRYREYLGRIDGRPTV